VKQSALLVALIAITGAIGEAQSTPSFPAQIELIGPSAHVFAATSNELRCVRCKEHVSYGAGGSFTLHDFHEGPGDESFAASNAQRSAGAETFVRVTNNRRSVDEDMGKRACGGESECHLGMMFGDCHRACPGGGSESLAENVERVLRKHDARGLSALFAAENGVVRINLDRAAIQILGCNETVAYHMPISATLIAQLNLPGTLARRTE